MAAMNQTPPVPPPAPQPPIPGMAHREQHFEGHAREAPRARKLYAEVDPHVINVPNHDQQPQPQPQLHPRLFHAAQGLHPQQQQQQQPQPQHEFRLPLHPRGPSYFQQEPIVREIRPEPKEKSPPKAEPKAEPELQLNSKGTLPPFYQGWTFTKLDPEKPGGKKTWSRAIKSEMPVSHTDLASQIRKQREKGIAVLSQYNGLNALQRAQVDRLVEEKNKAEKDQRLEWKLASAKKEERNIGISLKETVSMQVIVKRILKPAVTQSSPKEKLKTPIGIISDLNVVKPEPALKGIKLGAGEGPSHGLQGQKGGYQHQPGQPMMVPAGGSPHHFLQQQQQQQQKQQARPNVIYVDGHAYLNTRSMPAQPQPSSHGLPQQQPHPMNGGHLSGQQHGQSPIEVVHEQPQDGHQGRPQGHTSHGHPQGYSAQGHPAQGHPAQGHPAQGHPAQGHPAQGHPAQGHPAQGHPAQGHPAQNHPFQGFPHPGFAQQGHAQGHHQGQPQGHQGKPSNIYYQDPQGSPKKQGKHPIPMNLHLDPHLHPKAPQSPKKTERKKKVEEWVNEVTDTSDSESEPEVSVFDSSDNETVITPPSSSAGKSKHKDKHRRSSAAKDHRKRSSRQSREGHRPVYREHERRQAPPPLSPKESTKETAKEGLRVLDDEDYVVIPTSKILRGNAPELRRHGSQRPAERLVVHSRGLSYAYDDYHEQDRFASLGVGRRDSLMLPRRISETAPYRGDRFDMPYERERERERDYGDRAYGRGPDALQEMEELIHQEKMDRYMHNTRPPPLRRHGDSYGRARDLRDPYY